MLPYFKQSLKIEDLFECVSDRHRGFVEETDLRWIIQCFILTSTPTNQLSIPGKFLAFAATSWWPLVSIPASFATGSFQVHNKADAGFCSRSDARHSLAC